jgi:hypothetical protein
MSEPTQLRPAEHYREAQRILASLPSLGLDRDDLTVEVLTAVAHAVLATVDPRTVRAGRGRRPFTHALLSTAHSTVAVDVLLLAEKAHQR